MFIESWIFLRIRKFDKGNDYVTKWLTVLISHIKIFWNKPMFLCIIQQKLINFHTEYSAPRSNISRTSFLIISYTCTLPIRAPFHHPSTIYNTQAITYRPFAPRDKVESCWLMPLESGTFPRLFLHICLPCPHTTRPCCGVLFPPVAMSLDLPVFLSSLPLRVLRPSASYLFGHQSLQIGRLSDGARLGNESIM